MTFKEEVKCKNIHSQCATAVDMIMKSSLIRRTLDNVTILKIAFENFEKVFNESFHTSNSEERFSPKSSFYLYNAIENKEQIIQDGSNGYCLTDPGVKPTSPNKTEISPKIISKNNASEKKLNSIRSNNVNSFNSMTLSSMLNNYNSLVNKSNNRELNKVLSFEVQKKIILSPKNKNTNKIDFTDNNFLSKSPISDDGTKQALSPNYSLLNKNSQIRNLPLKLSHHKSLTNVFKKVQK
jgi:hypothetical protein